MYKSLLYLGTNSMIRQVIKTICRTNENIAGRHLADDKFHEILFI